MEGGERLAGFLPRAIRKGDHRGERRDKETQPKRLAAKDGGAGGGRTEEEEGKERGGEGDKGGTGVGEEDEMGVKIRKED